VALYESMQHMRYQSLFAICAVVVGSSILTEVLGESKQGNAGTRLKLLNMVALVAVSALCMLTFVRIADLISSRANIVADSGTLFGSGESWWFPERAAAFIRREKLPGNVFQEYNLGGFTAWGLGPDHRDFIDGRNVSPPFGLSNKDLFPPLPILHFGRKSRIAGESTFFYSRGFVSVAAEYRI
jgi:hypothetical protein